MFLISSCTFTSTLLYLAVILALMSMSSGCLSPKCFKTPPQPVCHCHSCGEWDEGSSHVDLGHISQLPRHTPLFLWAILMRLYLYHESSSRSDGHVTFHSACFYKVLWHVPIVILCMPGLRSFKVQVSLKAKMNSVSQD